MPEPKAEAQKTSTVSPSPEAKLVKVRFLRAHGIAYYEQGEIKNHKVPRVTDFVEGDEASFEPRVAAKLLKDAIVEEVK